MASNIISIISLLIIIFCFIYTIINKRKHPERYGNEKNDSAFKIIFGDFITDLKPNTKYKKDREEIIPHKETYHNYNTTNYDDEYNDETKTHQYKEKEIDEANEYIDKTNYENEVLHYSTEEDETMYKDNMEFINQINKREE